MSNSLLPANASLLEHTLDHLASHRLAFNLSVVDTHPLTCPVPLLSLLAASWQVDIRGLNEQESRQLIANAWQIHKYRGTVYAVKKALSSVFSKVQIEDTGTPFVFDIKVTLSGDAQQVYDLAKFATAKRLANDSKNLRSRFGEFVIALPQAHGQIVKTDAATLTGTRLSASLSLNANPHIHVKGALQWTL